jgi:molybdopterin synthase catalytic subunit
MHVLGIVGPAEEAAALTERVADALATEGRVAVVDADDEAAGPGAVAERHRLGADGWSIAREAGDLDDVLADLAPGVGYALLRGFPEATVPTVALGGADHSGETLRAAPDAGSVDPEALVEDLESAEPVETLESLVADVKRDADAGFAGAIATFTGRVRTREDPDDVATEFLEFEKYDGVAEATMADIRADLEAREGVHAVRLHHKTGVVEAGEDIVFVVVLAGHRPEAFEAVSDGIERLKAEVPLFKKEVTVEGEFWAHDRD